ncbi:hypothetical protein Daus18300_004426 [Diaporthe australafricana]|uniref:RED-like N-terminal domain-containing protein n=1 Tax=Diaporthe australafricana TaxID=127596 RepID=A0ABR3X808_9PEZI
MNNEQFRKLLLANSAKSPSGAQDGASPSPGATKSAGSSALGSRLKSSIPMTPRSVAGTGSARVDFARQLAERNNPDRPQKKFRTSAPKGTKFADGYVDRAKQRQAEQEEDDKASRIQALEESLKKEEIDQATFEKLRNEIAGGDLSSTHLIKGLDFKLLERVRKGEDVFNGDKPDQGKAESLPEEEDEPEGEDVDDAFEALEEKEVTAVEKEKAKKKGQLSTATLVPGQKRTRDQIVAEMKAAREAAKAQQESALGTRFKKIGAKKEPGSRIERDAKGREVLIIVDEDGNEKRKIRKVAAEVERERESFKIDPMAEVLGMEVPEYYKKKLEEQAKADADENVNMFSDVESDYDPLGGISSDSDDSDKSDGDEPKEAKKKSISPKSDGEVDSEGGSAVEEDMPPPPKPQAQHARSYFKSSLISEEQNARPAMNDPSVLAALKKAKTLNAATKSEEEQKEADRQERLKKMLASADRDAEDMDMGFGTNRLADEEELEDDGKTKLSNWGDDDDGEDGGGGKSKRKRGPKKKKGDVNSVSDVMKVLEKRKTAGS